MRASVAEPASSSGNPQWNQRVPLKPSSYRSADAASRNPQGGSLDPVVRAEPETSAAASSASPAAETAVSTSGRPVGDYAANANWVLGNNPSMRRIARSIQRAAEVECTVLVSGETGTGKELWARLLHRSGPRADKAFIPVNCAALTPSLAESQLFGHEKGAFTGAQGRSLGIFRAAQGGVVFLDEIGEMPLELQAKMLRLLQQREVMPVGSTEPVHVDVQIVAATNRDLEQEAEKGNFREDLYYRLNMIELKVPPLRERPDDIPEFIAFFSQQFADRYRAPVWEPSPEALEAFCSFPWPGNVRQLGHVIEQAYVLQIEPELPLLGGAKSSAAAKTAGSTAAGEDRVPYLDLAKLRRQAIKQALTETRGHKAKAAKLLGVHANTLTRMLREDGDEAASDSE
jgi:DNA-binding NtrC family response regulator